MYLTGIFYFKEEYWWILNELPVELGLFAATLHNITVIWQAHFALSKINRRFKAKNEALFDEEGLCKSSFAHFKAEGGSREKLKNIEEAVSENKNARRDEPPSITHWLVNEYFDQFVNDEYPS